MNPLVLAASSSEGFTAPGTADFWQPFVGSGEFALTRPIVVMVLTTVFLVVVMVVGTRRLSVVPGKGQAVLEQVYALPRNAVGRDIIGASEVRPFLPLLLTVFSTILVSNLLGVLPFVQFPTTSRVAFPIAFMLFVYVTYLATGFRRKGGLGYLKSLVPAGLPVLIVPVIFLLELLTTFVTQPITLALRLFGNMFAGHIILLLFSLGGEYFLLQGIQHGNVGFGILAIPTYVLYFVLYVFEILIEFLQAYVFTLLSATYIANSLAHEH